ncbi:MAG: peptide chain release factor N(5)-glutamine methyltransferase [Candidatus Eremiobacteraeota bacterium]|nr:peptide chain release factor N(5)-glutamine methyltransferase [Candidatus Eremiobacteraeota bacterium]
MAVPRRVTIEKLREFLLSQSSVQAPDVQRILSYVTGRSEAWLRAYGETEVSPKAESQAREFAQRRASGEPLPYILGTAGFHGHSFLVDNRVLVPRPETEHLVDEALEFINDKERPRVLDVGTGSGAIACSILAETGTNVHANAIDVSADALLVAMANAQRLGVEPRLTFFIGDVSTPALRPFFDVIVANLPYVPTKDIAPSPDPVSFEPRIALDGGADGLDQYRRFLKHAPRLLALDGIVLMEAAPPIIADLEALARAAFPAAEVTIGIDYGKRARYVKVRTRE